MDTSRLGVVIPCYNENEWIRRSVEALHEAARRAGWPLEVLVVDDGSAEPTASLIDTLAGEGLVRALHQSNAGRFEARLAGLNAINADYVLLLDSRVIVSPDSLVALRARVDAEPTSAWNAHVEVITDSNPYAAFMYGITKVGWRRYFARPRVVRFGPDDFDAYPKGTGAFAAPRETLIAAAAEFSSLFADQKFASDDTKMLRNVAEMTPIGIDPAFSVDYYGRDSLQSWLKQVWFRGTTFVDGYVGTPGRAAALLGLVGIAVPVGACVALRHPRLAVGTVACGAGAAAAATRASGGTAKESAAVAGLLVPFAAVFGAGFVRGLLMAVRR